MTTSDTALPVAPESAMALRPGLQMTPCCRGLGLTAPVVQAPVGSAWECSR